MEVIARRHARLDLEAVAAVFEHADERDEEVVHAVAKLLDVGVLVGGSLVAVNADPLVDPLPVEVEPLAERFHDELLQIAAEEQQPILVGQDDHVLLPLPPVA